MRRLGEFAFWLSYRVSFLVAKWRLGWSYWNEDGKNVGFVKWPTDPN